MSNTGRFWLDTVLAGAVPCLVGAGLTLADRHTPATGALTLLFLLLVPALGVWFLLPRLDPFARATVAGTTAVVLATAVAQVMLTTSTWSQRGGGAAIMAASGLLVISRVVRRWLVRRIR